MIEGLKIRVTSDELMKHLKDRAAYHRQRADEKEKGIPELEQALQTVSAVNQNPASITHANKFSNSYHSDPKDVIDALQTDIRQHRNTALAFDFFAGHLFTEDYTLSESDLKRLEILR